MRHMIASLAFGLKSVQWSGRTTHNLHASEVHAEVMPNFLSRSSVHSTNSIGIDHHTKSTHFTEEKHYYNLTSYPVCSFSPKHQSHVWRLVMTPREWTKNDWFCCLNSLKRIQINEDKKPIPRCQINFNRQHPFLRIESIWSNHFSSSLYCSIATQNHKPWGNNQNKKKCEHIAHTSNKVLHESW